MGDCIWIESEPCMSGRNCLSCRSSASWRRPVAAPEVCPFGCTLENVSEFVAKRNRPYSENQEAQRRRAICRDCDEFNGNRCERKYPKGCCSCTWAQFLKAGTCEKWSSVESAAAS